MSGDGRRGRSNLTVRVRSRWDDCDRYGHVNNAAFLALVRAAHERAGLPAGELRALEIAYRQPVPPEAMVDVTVAVLEGRIRPAPQELLDDLLAGEPPGVRT